MQALQPKIVTALKGYTRAQLIKDITAGVIVGIIALPLSIALALASGVRPEQGLYTAIVAGFLISLLGGSRVQIAGPTAAFATIVAGIVARSGMQGLIIATIMAGLLLVLMGVFRLGTLIKYIPYTITTGFTAGIAVCIAIGQFKDFLGVTYLPGLETIETMDKLTAVAASIGSFQWQALLVGLVALAVLILWPRVSKRIPGSLVAVLVGIAMVKLLPLQVNTIGDLYTISGGLPVLTLPQLSLGRISAMFPDAVTIALLAAIESLLSCVVADGMVGSHHNANMELVAQGLGNIGSALLGGIPATGAIARTAANINNGGRTPVAGMVHAVTLLLILVVLMPYASLIPMPVIAAILLMVAWHMSGAATFARLCRLAPKSDIIVLVTTFLLTVLFDLVVAIGAGMMLVCILFVKRMSEESRVRAWQDADQTEVGGGLILPEGTRVYELEGPLFFGVADKLTQGVSRKDCKCIILRMRAVTSIDVTALMALQRIHADCAKRGITLVLSHLNPQPESMLQKAGFLAKVGAENCCAHLSDALSRAEAVTGA
ncbi:MAG: SulP family inorganic anion transporter [Candidatus Limiplasma sp.]|nr:SulP family inorganic anion transporter [Candidatus Limiplasma sp.]MEA5145105.1 SulP family inorganic anion transporter [Candidatus Limiplasma sp.]